MKKINEAGAKTVIHGHFPFCGTHLHGGIKENVSGMINWRTVCREKNRYMVNAIMAVGSRDDTHPQGRVSVELESLDLLSEGHRETQNEFLRMLGWNGEREYDIHCR